MDARESGHDMVVYIVILMENHKLPNSIIRVLGHHHIKNSNTVALRVERLSGEQARRETVLYHLDSQMTLIVEHTDMTREMINKPDLIILFAKPLGEWAVHEGMILVGYDTNL